MRRSVLLVVLLVGPLLLSGAASQPDPIPLTIDHRLLNHEGEPVEGLEAGSGGILNVTTTNGHNRTINVTYQVIQPDEGGNGTPISGARTGPIQANASRATPLPITVAADAPAGPRNLTLRGTVEVLQDGNWTVVGNATRNVTLQIVAPTPKPRPFPVVPAALVVIAVALGSAGAYLHLRQPESRVPPERSQEEIQRGIEERQQSIQEAKRQDIQDAIDRARERYEAGDLTEYQFERIKENKQEQLDELEGDDG